MTKLKTLVLMLATSAPCVAGVPLQDLSSPFDGKDCEVVWNAQTNLPASVKVFTVVPTKFSPETVSNLLQIAGLAQKNKKRLSRGGVLGGKDVLTYANKEDSRHLDIIPSQGTIGLGIDGTEAIIPKEMPVGVPSAKEAIKIATNLMHRLGFKLSDLVPFLGGELAPATSKSTVLHKEKSSGLMVTNIVSRDVFLYRQLDGIPVTGSAGVSMTFGNEGKLGYLSIVWRAVKPAKACAVPTPSEFISIIKSNRALIFVEQAGKPYKKLIIKKASILYWESEGSQPQTTIYPFAVLDTETDLPGADSKARLYVTLANE